MTFFICHNLAISSFNKLYFSIFSCSLITYSCHCYLLVLPHLYNHCLFLYLINYHNIWSSGFYHVITLYGEIPQNFEIFVFNYIFRFMFIQSFALLNPSFLQNCQCTCLHSYTIITQFVLFLGKFARFTHYMRYSLISCITHLTKG